MCEIKTLKVVDENKVKEVNMLRHIATKDQRS